MISQQILTAMHTQYVFHHNINIKENVFPELELKKGLSAWTLIDSSKLANRIARLVASLLKIAGS